MKQLGIAALYALLLYLGDYFFESKAVIGHFEPASGLALAALLIGGKRYAWGIFFGAVLTHVIQGNPLLETAIVAPGDTLQALCGFWLLNRESKFDLRLASLRGYFLLVIVGGVASVLLGALVVNLALLVCGLLSPFDYLESLLHWLMTDSLGIILVTPLILAWRQTKINWREKKKIIEACLLLGLVILAGQIIFLGWLQDIIGQSAKGYWMFLFISWVAMLLGTRGTTSALLVATVQALIGAMHGVGYFANDIAASGLANFWFYILILSLVGMSLATYFQEIKQANLSISHRDTLIREIHHRIKNNLQGITGLLRQLADKHPETAESISQTIGQVQSIAAIHGLQEGVPAGNMQLRKLAEAVATGVGSLWQVPVTAEIPPDLAAYTIDEAEAVPLALILNELLSNAIKHGGRLGQIKIALTPGQRPGSIQLTIHNPGQRLPDFNSGSNSGAGLQLVKSLMPKAGASLSWQQQDNTVLTLLELEPPVITLEPEP